MIKQELSSIINLIIIIITAILVVGFFREDGRWNPAKGKKALRYFTTQSNVLCAVSALAMCLFPDKDWAYYLKVMGTAAVTVTMLTVLFFLGRIYGYIALLKGSDLFMHLITPLLAIVSLCVFERRGIGLGAAFVGIIPVALYAPLYLYNVVFAPQEKRWDDFYSFNKDGKWPIAYSLMVAGAAVICVVYYFILNL
ncbi:hypothetical protein [Butyrivibrio sp. FCS014]|uniref:hypothetical protein n=1 Tax=Butyrivibrio sp. FCS014 TaxID=1408304 RepID=UPI0004631EB9|nr:hypothetical protein [Butyrivibrio sp. FCS014]